MVARDLEAPPGRSPDHRSSKRTADPNDDVITLVTVLDEFV
ncbi:hypothetical protein [Actinoalloteichus spitiensis]|nr:hypothetical protein [Actinoalloteichus spitiensis]